MRSIKGLNTKPEILIRKILFANGLRYRIHQKKLPGRPDISFPKKKLAIFINGCFWHHHTCSNGHIPVSNTAFWEKKILANIKRDKKNIKSLKELGWSVIIIWECQINKNLPNQIQRIIKSLKQAENL